MKAYLISPDKNQYKANMHGHSHESDGKLSLDEIKSAYKERGYSVYAFSDHRKVKYHERLADPEFLPLAAAELDVSQPGSENFNLRKSFHFNIIARDPKCFEQVDCSKTPFGIDCINALIREAKEKNYIVVANHPNWSLFTEDEFLAVEGLDGFELYNTITANYGGALSFTPEIYMYLLRNGRNVMAIGADDCHSFCLPFSNPQNDSFGGFTYILADSLDYDSIIKALDEKKTYCSQGPQIFEFSVDGDEVYVKTSEAVKITLLSESRFRRFTISKPGETINEASFKLDRKLIGSFILLHVVDSKGKNAMTSAFYMGKDF